MDREKRVGIQIRNRRSYQRFLRWLNLMRQGKYFRVLFEIHQELDFHKAYRYRTTYVHATESFLTLGEDYAEKEDAIFKEYKTIIVEKQVSVTTSGCIHGKYVRGSEMNQGVEDYHLRMMERVNAWSKERKNRIGARFSRRGGKDGAENEFAWIGRNLAEKPPYSGV